MHVGGWAQTGMLPASVVTCFSGNSMNSSVLATSTKCCSTYLCAALSRSLHECVSANPRMPRQLEGSSWLRRNLQQASRTPFNCRRLAAGSRVWGMKMGEAGGNQKSTENWILRRSMGRPGYTDLGWRSQGTWVWEWHASPERCLRPPQSQPCMQTVPAGLRLAGQCHAASHVSGGSHSSHL